MENKIAEMLTEQYARYQSLLGSADFVAKTAEYAKFFGMKELAKKLGYVIEQNGKEFAVS